MPKKHVRFNVGQTFHSFSIQLRRGPFPEGSETFRSITSTVVWKGGPGGKPQTTRKLETPENKKSSKWLWADENLAKNISGNENGS